MNFRQIDCFRAVMHTGSMTLAAAELHTSQPNVSRAIALLQRETQMQLFARAGLRVVPTPEAHALLKEVDRVYVGLQSISAAADRIRTLGVEGLRIAVTPALGISPVPRVLQVFRGLRPRVPVVVHTADSATICKWVSSRYCDLGLSAYVALPQEVDSELVLSERAVCIVPRGHRLARKRKVVPADLAVLHEHRAQFRSLCVRRLGLFGSFVRGEQRVDSDMDFLVEFEPDQKTFDHFMNLTVLLEDLLHRRIELVTTGRAQSLHWSAYYG